jgi:lysine-specific demethylase 8
LRLYIISGSILIVTDLPDVLDNISRADSLESRDFLNRFASRHVPVVIGDAQEHASISKLVSERDVVDRFGDVLIQVQQNYTSAPSRTGADTGQAGLSQKVRNDIAEMRLRDYCNHIKRNPGTDLLCVEYRTPPRILAEMRMPPYCDVQGAAEELVSFMFVANKGNYAHLHFDGDFRHVLLYQVFGRKRVVIVPLAAQAKISPSMNFSKLLIQNMREEEKRYLFKYLDAYECILEPGDTIYFPPSVWHYVEYLDTGMSVNFRFGRSDFAREVVDANRVPFYPDLHLMLHRVAMLDDEGERAGLEAMIRARMRSVLCQEYKTSRDRHCAVQDMYRSLVSAMPGGGRPSSQVTGDCLIAEAMAVERYDSPTRQWREELMLGEPL